MLFRWPTFLSECGMRLKQYCVRGLALAGVATWTGACAPRGMIARAPAPTAADSAGIERLHRLDVTATLADKVDSLESLWDPGAIRIQPGGPAEIGRAVIYADDKRQERKTGGGKTVCYRSEIQDLLVTGEWAFEWGYFSYREMSDTAAIRGKVMRILKRQPDGSWKFARVMGFVERNESAAPLAHPCR
jgi:hypothetical protein